ncbi:nitric oxide synthase oxygenase [Kribbella solani]|uniref:Nitric-oxide synthase n=1 Tax=Kribbella solani TaxID=236067 RepID=A0A841DSE8_9ACTN|nr:nitric oxide synthase oxygenase [Kribbella solani]MBB5979696.1 nitric-oxide synthase [Kribbella solani]
MSYIQGRCPAHPNLTPSRSRRSASRRLPAVPLGVFGLILAGAAIGLLGFGRYVPGGVPPAVPIALGLAMLLLAVGICARHLAAGRTGEQLFQLSRRRGSSRWNLRSVVRRPPRIMAAPRRSEPRPDPERVAARVDTGMLRAAAKEFLELFHSENPTAGPLGPRLAAVLHEIDTTGTYWHTPEELEFGAQVAWRNNKRCIGRLYWRSLQVRDLRGVSDAGGVAAHCFEHLTAAYNGGKIRPMITVFAPETPSRPGPRIWNEQLIRYAGYDQPSGRPLGDPRYREFTDYLIKRGWRPPERRGAFDVLPLVVETVEEGPRLFQLPHQVVHEVELRHPELPWFADLDLRWHAVPVISNSRLVIGGISYPAAPFNGWYMGTEIGARNLADTDRYDLVPEVAERLGLDTSHDTSLWRDRALVELNRAVLHSFGLSGVTVTDHHTESRRFLLHLEKEERAGRTCPADWSWIVPPMSGSQTPVFHRYYDTETRTPAFTTDPDSTTRALQGDPPAFS